LELARCKLHVIIMGVQYYEGKEHRYEFMFGMHGATAVGWMTLEGTKSEGTDLPRSWSLGSFSRGEEEDFYMSQSANKRR
jgi:hypothetical protein